MPSNCFDVEHFTRNNAETRQEGFLLLYKFAVLFNSELRVLYNDTAFGYVYKFTGLSPIMKRR